MKYTVVTTLIMFVGMPRPGVCTSLLYVWEWLLTPVSPLGYQRLLQVEIASLSNGVSCIRTYWYEWYYCTEHKSILKHFGWRHICFLGWYHYLTVRINNSRSDIISWLLCFCTIACLWKVRKRYLRPTFVRSKCFNLSRPPWRALFRFRQFETRENG